MHHVCSQEGLPTLATFLAHLLASPNLPAHAPAAALPHLIAARTRIPYTPHTTTLFALPRTYHTCICPAGLNMAMIGAPPHSVGRAATTASAR